MVNGKGLGPNGLNVEFYLFYWDIIKEPLFKAITHFLTSAQLPSSWGKTFIVLIPKLDKPRTVSLCNVSYKIVSKILTNSLKHVMHKIVGQEQSSFLAWKSSFDNIIAIQEIVYSLESDIESPPRMILKVNIAKAYDMIEWETILATLHLLNFLTLWINWIRACISNASFALLINGHVGRGLRQGDPLFPYLFLLVSQNLSAKLNNSLVHYWIPGFDERLNRNFNHLMFADDLVIVSKASRSVAKSCKLCLTIYNDQIGQTLMRANLPFTSLVRLTRRSVKL